MFGGLHDFGRSTLPTLVLSDRQFRSHDGWRAAQGPKPSDGERVPGCSGVPSSVAYRGTRIDENRYYSDSIELVLEKNPLDHSSTMPNLTVCSFSAVLVSALATTYGTELISQSIIYHDYVSTNGTTLPPRRFLFHENWLDRAYSYDPTLSLSDAILNPENFNSTAYNVGTTYNSTSWSFPTGSMVHPDNFTYPARPGMFPQRNSFGRLGASLVHAVGHPNLDSKGREMDTSFRAEATVGGILTYMLTWSLPSFSQYSMPYDQIPEKFRLGPPQSFPHQYDAKYYVSGYGYRLSNRTGILGVVVLVSHAVLATAASVWQLLRRRGIMQAWSTVPDYVCLGSGSSSVVATHPNTCAGIAGEDGLCSVVRIVETARDEQAEKDGSTPHLEVMAVQRVVTTGALEVDLGDDKKKYGFTERKHKSE